MLLTGALTPTLSVCATTGAAAAVASAAQNARPMVDRMCFSLPADAWRAYKRDVMRFEGGAFRSLPDVMAGLRGPRRWGTAGTREQRVSRDSRGTAKSP